MHMEDATDAETGYDKPVVEETIDVVALLTGKHGLPGGQNGGHS